MLKAQQTTTATKCHLNIQMPLRTDPVGTAAASASASASATAQMLLWSPFSGSRSQLQPLLLCLLQLEHHVRASRIAAH